MKCNAIDISYCQATPSYATLKKSGIKMVTIKATQGGPLNTGAYSPFVDPKFKEHADAAVKAKMPMSFYHFLISNTVEGAKKEAEYFLRTIQPYSRYCLYAFLDCEVYGIKTLETLSRSKLTDVCKAFMDVIYKSGMRPALYTNPDHINSRLYLNKLVHPVWLANYANTRPNVKNLIMWQYGVGAVKGLTGEVDLNESYIPEAEYAAINLSYKGFISNPTYWIGQFKKIKYLDCLFIAMDATFKFMWSPSIRVDWACTYLRANGVMNSPDYWVKKAKSDKWLNALLCNFGGGIK